MSADSNQGASARLQYLRAFRHRNFKLFFVGQLLSMSGTWMHRVAQGWLAYRLTHSPFMLGLVSFAGSAPAVFLSPVAGVIADRMDRHRMLMAAQALAMMQALSLALVTLEGWITPTQLIFFALAGGIINSFENPARQSFIVQLVPRQDIVNAIGLNAVLANIGRIAGPAFAGIIVAAFSEGLCFFINALSFMIVLVCLQLMHFEKRRGDGKSSQSQWELLREGTYYIRKTFLVRSLLLLFAVMSFAGAPYLALLPMFAGTVLDVGASGLGWLVTASGVGALVCGFALAGRTESSGLVKAILLASLAFGSGLIGLGLSRNFYLSLAILSVIGGSYLLTLAATQTLLQSLTPDELRGRVMSFYSLVFLGFPPFGSLLEGWIAEHLGVALTVQLGGLICFGAALLFARYYSEIQAAASRMAAAQAAQEPIRA